MKLLFFFILFLSLPSVKLVVEGQIWTHFTTVPKAYQYRFRWKNTHKRYPQGQFELGLSVKLLTLSSGGSLQSRPSPCVFMISQFLAAAAPHNKQCSQKSMQPCKLLGLKGQHKDFARQPKHPVCSESKSCELSELCFVYGVTSSCE